MTKFKETSLRLRWLTLFVFLAFVLICSLNTYAQDFPDLLNYNLNGNDAPGSVWNSTTTSGGQIYRGEGASYNPSGFVAPCSSLNYTSIPSCQESPTQTAVAQCSWILTQLSGTTVTATAGGYNGGSLVCTAVVSPLTTSTADWAFAGDWTNYYDYLNNQEGAESELAKTQPGDPNTANYVATEQCMTCHNQLTTGAGHGTGDQGSYLLTGHKNGFRKIVSGQTLHSSDGSVYTGITWTTPPAQPTDTANGKPIYYNIAGWMTPGAAPDLMYYEGASAGCAYCHVSGYNPVAQSTAGLWGGTPGADGSFTWGGSGTAQTTYPGPEPTQVIPVTGVTITGVSIATAGNQAPVVFTATGTLPGSVAANAYVQVNGFTTATGEPLNGTTLLVSGVNGQTITAASTIPDSYYAAGTSTTETGTMVVLSPIPANSTGVIRLPENAATGDSSWYLTGVTCERCHLTEVGTSTVGAADGSGSHSNNSNCSTTTVYDQFITGHEFTCVAGSISLPVYPSGTGATELCMECHRLQVASTKGAAAITPLYPPLVKYSASTGVYSDGDYQGSEFLNSPHAQYVGTLLQNSQGTADLSVDFTGSLWTGTGTYSSAFTGVNQGTGTTNSGCTGCHDPHQTIVGSEYTGVPLANAPTAIQNANLLQPTTYAAAATTGVGTANTYTNLNWGALMGSGTFQANNCDNCHSTAGPGASVFNSTTDTWTVLHPVGPPTMFPNSSSGSISSLDVPGACMVCHMQGASGQPQKHFFRINPSATYYTYNTSANYNATATISAYAVSGTNVTFTAGAFTSGSAAVGDEITVSGASPSVLNNSYIVTSFTTTSFTASVVPLGSPTSITGSGSTGGTATVSAVPYNTYVPSDAEYSPSNPFITGNNAIALDVDIACGQCHGGGTVPNQNPYGIALPNPPPPWFSRTYLADAATGIHGSIAAQWPTFSPPAGSYTGSQSVTLTSGTSTAAICYTTNGSAPTAATAGTCDSNGGVELQLPNPGMITTVSSGTETVNAIATAVGYTNSAVDSATYTITVPLAAASPTFNPPAGPYTASQTVSITSATSGATICYTTNGTPPGASPPGTCVAGSTTLANGATITVSSSETVEALATEVGYTNSAVSSAAYIIGAAAITPTFNPPGGTYTGPQTVTISSNTPSATICYTLNGTRPTATGGACNTSTTEFSFGVGINTGTISVSTSETVEAMAAEPGYNNSAVASSTYKISLPTAATPTFSEAAGIYYTPQTVAISSTTSTAVICYTTNGNAPTAATAGTCDSTSGEFSLANGATIPAIDYPETVKAIATAVGYTNSAVTQHKYTIKALAPTFSPEGGTYTTAQTVTITDNSNSSTATIYYAFNAAPTTTSTSCPSPCTGVIVSTTETLEAVAAYDSGLLSESSVKSATYTLKTPAPTFSPGAGTYSTAQSVTLSDTLSGVTICYTIDGSTPTLGTTADTCTNGTWYQSAITVSTTTTIKAIAGLSDGYTQSNVVSKTYTIK